MIREGCCIHFNGTCSKVCKAGVDYKTFGEGKSIPCIAKYARPDTPKCELRQEPTPEQIEQARAETAKLFERTATARKAIVDHLGGPWKKGAPAAKGSIECPHCKGRLNFSRAGYNGHIHAACSTADCVSWME